MPIYLYQCECGIEFEALILAQAHHELVDCPRCHSKKIEQIPAMFGFKFKSNPLGAYRGACANPYENLVLDHVRDAKGRPVRINSLKELRAAEKAFNFVHALSNDDDISAPPQHESWAGDVRRDYQWKWTPPSERDDKAGVSAGATIKENLLVGDRP